MEENNKEKLISALAYQQADILNAFFDSLPESSNKVALLSEFTAQMQAAIFSANLKKRKAAAAK